MEEENNMSGCPGCGRGHDGKNCEMEGCDAPGTECVEGKCVCVDCAGKMKGEGDKTENQM